MKSRMMTAVLISVLTVLAGAAIVSDLGDSDAMTIATATVGEPYSYQLVDAGSVDSTLYSGSYPPGLSLSNGYLTGTPTSAGTYTFTLYNCDTDSGEDTYDDYTITVNAEAVDYVTAVSVSPSSTTVDVGDTFTLTAGLTSGTVYSSVTWIYSDSYVTLDSGQHTLSASFTATAAGSVTIQAQVYAGESIVRGTCSLTIDTGEDDITYTSPSAVSAVSGSSITYTPAVNISGSTFTLTDGASWLSMSDGVLTGTAPTVTSATDYTASIRATSPGGQVAVQTVTFTVYPVAQLSADTSVSGIVGASLSVTVSSNISGTVFATPSLPSGLSLNGTTGVISGTPTAAGTFSVTVNGTTSEGLSQTPSIVLTFYITESLGIVSDYPTGTFVSGSSYSYTPAATVSGVTWSVSGLSWLAISSGTVTGSVPAGLTSPATYTYTLTATYTLGSNTQTATQSVTVSAEPVLEFTTVPTASCVVIPVYDYNDDGTYSSDQDTLRITYTYRFVFTGENAESVLWDFGDGETSADWSPTHTYAASGTYDYSLTATNSVGSDTCYGSLTIPDEVSDSESNDNSIIDQAIAYWYVILLIGIVVCFVIWVLIHV